MPVRNSAVRAGLLAVVSIVIASSTHAQQDAEERERDLDDFGIDAGTWELSLGAIGSWREQDGTDVETWTAGANVRLGLFFTEVIEVAGKAEYLFQETDFGDSRETETHSVLAGPELILNFPTETRVLPYVVGSGGIVYSELQVDDDRIADEFGAFWEAGGGLRFFVSRSAAIDVRAVFQQLLFEDEGDVNSVIGTVGLSLFF